MNFLCIIVMASSLQFPTLQLGLLFILSQRAGMYTYNRGAQESRSMLHLPSIFFRLNFRIRDKFFGSCLLGILLVLFDYFHNS